MVAEVEVVQKYYNSQDQPVEAQYVFPLDNRSAVCSFCMALAGREVKGQVREKEDAKKSYEAAVEQGQSAAMLTQHQPDIFQLDVGNIPPSTDVQVTIKYTTELIQDGAPERFRFFLPTTVFPRYCLAGSQAGVGIPSATAPKDAGLTLEIKADMQSMVKSVTIPSHPDDIRFQGAGSRMQIAKRSVMLEVTQAIDLDRDLVVSILCEAVQPCRMIVEKCSDLKSTAAMLTLIPAIELDECSAELIFVVDRSGSMSGSSISQVRQALQLYLRSLPVDCYFNIVGFGSSFTKLFPASTKYSKESMEQACEHAKKIEANLGGTEILAPLQDVLAQPLADKNYLRQVFVLTDGQVYNEASILDLIKRNNSHSRCFAMGIGSGCGKDLVEGIARVGQGTAEFFGSFEDNLSSKVLKQLQQAVAPALNNVSVEWIYPQSSGSSAVGLAKDAEGEAPAGQGPASQGPMVAPWTAPPIFSGSRLLSFAIWPEGCQLPEGVRVAGKGLEEELAIELSMQDDGEQVEGSLLHSLAARAAIRDLEEGTSALHQDKSQDQSKTIEGKIIDLGCRYNITSSKTTYVAIEVAVEGGNAKTVGIETQLEPGEHMGFGGSAMPGFGSARFGGSAMPGFGSARFGGSAMRGIMPGMPCSGGSAMPCSGGSAMPVIVPDMPCLGGSAMQQQYLQVASHNQDSIPYSCSATNHSAMQSLQPMSPASIPDQHSHLMMYPQSMSTPECQYSSAYHFCGESGGSHRGRGGGLFSSMGKFQTIRLPDSKQEYSCEEVQKVQQFDSQAGDSFEDMMDIDNMDMLQSQKFCGDSGNSYDYKMEFNSYEDKMDCQSSVPKGMLVCILQTQGFNGLFPLPGIERALQSSPGASSLEQLRVDLLQLVASGAAPSDPGALDRAGTLLALLLFQRCYAQHKGLWELAAKKARKWLASEMRAKQLPGSVETWELDAGAGQALGSLFKALVV